MPNVQFLLQVKVIEVAFYHDIATEQAIQNDETVLLIFTLNASHSCE